MWPFLTYVAFVESTQSHPRIFLVMGGCWPKESQAVTIAPSLGLSLSLVFSPSLSLSLTHSLSLNLILS